MRIKFTVFLLALNVIVFGLIAYLGERAGQELLGDGGLSGQISRGIVEADRIELRGQGISTARILVREGSTWRIREPMQWSANYFAVNRILNQLQFLEEEVSFSVKEIEDAGKSLADYGLDNPLIELTIADGDDTLTLAIGILTEIGNNIYILSPNGEEIFVVNRQVIDGLLIEMSDLRTREIFDIPVFEVEALDLQIKSLASVGEGDLKVRLARTATGWNFEAPLSAVANPALVSNTINTLTAAKVMRFIDPETIDPILLGLESPFMRVTIQGNKRRQTLIVGNPDSEAPEGTAYYARLDGNPTIFTISAKPFDELREAQEALRERNFMRFDDSELTAINITEGDRQLRLQRLETDGWQVIESNTGGNIQPRRADKKVMSHLIAELGALRARGFAVDNPSATDLERLGFNQPRRSVTLISGDNSQSTLRLAHPANEDKNLYARVDDKEFIYEVERRATLAVSPLNALHYRNRTLDVLPEAALITSLKLEEYKAGKPIIELYLEDAAQPWTVALSNVEQAAAEQVLELLSSVRNFTVKSYLGDGFTEDGYRIDESTTLPWKYRLKATISLPGGDVQRTEVREYIFTERRSGTIQIGGSAARDCTFEISQDLLDALYELTDSMVLPQEMNSDVFPGPEAIEPIEAPVLPNTD